MQSSPNNKPLPKSRLTIEIKPYEIETDLYSLAERITEIRREGYIVVYWRLTWSGCYKTVDVAYGMQKLVLEMLLDDDKIEVGEVIEAVEQQFEEVMSVDVPYIHQI